MVFFTEMPFLLEKNPDIFVYLVRWEKMSLENWVQEFKTGNKDAFNKIYKETFSLVRFAIYTYVQDKDTIEDLIQDTYMKVNERIKAYNSRNFKNWIYTIAKNTAIDYTRKKKETRIEYADSISSPANPYLSYVLNHLDNDKREVFLMKVLCGHTTKKIASILNLEPSVVNQYYYQAKAILKKNLEEDTYEFKKI